MYKPSTTPQIKSNQVYLKSFFLLLQTSAKGYSPDFLFKNQQYYNNNPHSSIHTGKMSGVLYHNVNI